MIQQDLLKETITCPHCNGTGDPVNHERETNICPICEGEGELTKEQYDDFFS